MAASGRRQALQVSFAIRNKMVAYQEELAQIIARDQAKHIADARGEVGRVIQIVENACGLPNMLIGETFQISASTRGQVLRKPLGPIGGLSPFNFPALVLAGLFPTPSGAEIPLSIRPASSRRSLCNG